MLKLEVHVCRRGVSGQVSKGQMNKAFVDIYLSLLANSCETHEITNIAPNAFVARGHTHYIFCHEYVGLRFELLAELPGKASRRILHWPLLGPAPAKDSPMEAPASSRPREYPPVDSASPV